MPALAQRSRVRISGGVSQASAVRYGLRAKMVWSQRNILTSLLLWRAQRGLTVLGFSALYVLAEHTVNVEIWLAHGRSALGASRGSHDAFLYAGLRSTIRIVEQL